MRNARDGKLKSIEVNGQNATLKLKTEPDTKYTSRIGKNTDIEKVLTDNGAVIGGSGDQVRRTQVQGALTVGRLDGAS